MEDSHIQVIDPGAYCLPLCPEMDIPPKRASIEAIPLSSRPLGERLYEGHDDFPESTPSEATLDTSATTAEDSVSGIAESVAGDPIYIGGIEDRDEPRNGRVEEDEDDLELTDDELDAPEGGKNAVEPEEEGPPAPLPLPQEHIYVQDPRQPLLLRDFHVLKTLGKCDLCPDPPPAHGPLMHFQSL